MRSNLAKYLLTIGVLGLFLVNLGMGLANSSIVGKSGLMDTLVQHPITANDLKPAECAGLNLSNIVTGSGMFTGTTGNDLILGSASDDNIDGQDGNDCILAGGGNNRLLGGSGSLSGTVRDEFNTISFSNNDGPQTWASNWSEIGESDGPVNGDVNVEVSQGRGTYTLYADQDSWIEQSHPTDNHGSENQLKVKTQAGQNERALYHYDLSALPAGSNVISATAYFWVTGSNANPVNVHRMTNSWDEGSVTWASISGSYDPASVGSFTPSQNNQYVTLNLTALAQAWLNGAVPNDGLTLISTVSNETKYSSKEATGNVGKPYLVVEISPGGGVNMQFADQDSWIEQSHPTDNHASDTEVKVKLHAGQNERAVYRFSLSTLPANATVVSATAYFWITGSDSNPVNVHPITAAWTESGVTWNNISGSFDPTPVGSFTPAQNNQYVSVDVTGLARAWLNGTYPNNGLMLISTADHETKYSSKEATGNVKNPYLTIVFETGGPAQALRIQNANKGAGRQVNLCNDLSAALQFTYLRQGLDDANDYVAIQISKNGGSSWTELARFAGPSNDVQMQPASYNITAFISCSPLIRFMASPQLGPLDQVYFDNIQISYIGTGSTGGDDVLLGGPGNDDLDGGPGTDTCYGGSGSNTFQNCETTSDP